MIAERIALIGADGNMGKRYRAIMNWKSIPYIAFDLQNIDSLPDSIKDIESFIVATPTNNHFDILMTLKQYNLPILCEKPITKSKDEIEKLLMSNIKLAMVNQYEFLLPQSVKEGESHYNYFKSGEDGLIWDCINIIGMSKNKPMLSNYSPIWDCKINDFVLNIKNMDGAYLDMIMAWKSKPWEDKEYIYNAHKKTCLMMS